MSQTTRRFVRTDQIKAAVIGREPDVLAALGISWRGTGQIPCPYDGHEDRNPS